MLDSDQVDCMSNFLVNTLNVEGSFSDSGISDSGSEQDMCEREKRLALLKKLARHLESILAPGSEALLNIMKVYYIIYFLIAKYDKISTYYLIF